MSRISIILPIYNVEAYIRQALDSLVNQTFKDIEIICVDDCSPDNSVLIIKEYAKQDNRIKLIELEQNEGQGNARNVGIEASTSEYIMFLDPDDWFEIDACEKAYNKITQNNNEFVVFDFYRYYEERNVKEIDCHFSKLFDTKLKSFNPRECDFQFLTNGFTWNKIYKASFLKGNNIYFSKNRFLEDVVFSIHLWGSAKNFSIIPEPLLNYRKKETGNVTIDYSQFYTHVLDVHNNNYEYIKSLENHILLKNYLVYSIRLCLHWFKHLGQMNTSIKDDFYKLLHSYFILLNKENDISKISKEINFKEFKLVINNDKIKNYEQVIFLKNIFKKLFSISNTSKGKVLSFLFIEIVLKKK